MHIDKQLNLNIYNFPQNVLVNLSLINLRSAAQNISANRISISACAEHQQQPCFSRSNLLTYKQHKQISVKSQPNKRFNIYFKY